MKKFIGKVLIFLLCASIACSIIPLVLWYTSMYEKFVSGKDIYTSIRESKKLNKQKKLIIGDSVAQQLFPNTERDSSFVSLTCNMALEMCGHFLLLNNYMMAGNRVDTVYLVYHPLSFKYNLNQSYTFQYFIKPFYTDEYNSYFTQIVHEQIAKIPNYRMARLLPIRTSNWMPNFVCKDSVINFMSPLSLEYLKRMKALANSHNFQLILFPDPVTDSMKYIVNKIDRQILVEHDLDKEFDYYFENITYLNDSVFVDEYHFRKEYVKQYADIYRKKIIN
jgi:hypothetical protein